MPKRVNKTKCEGGGGSVENYVFFRGGQICNGIAHYSWAMNPS